ncbi:MAG: ABC transporter substrate-binding protein [Candidatus Shapirobacteria bacterium]|nr:ABC transporter substrate-binding protein [Candidatus Shapirobacteria bacterium]
MFSAISFFVFKKQLIYFYELSIWHPEIIGVQGQYTLDSLPREITEKISLGLTVNDENQKPTISSLVTNIDIENDNKEFIFTLKNNISWSSGKKFTAYDINYQIPGVDITPVSESIVKITTFNDFSPLLTLLTKPLIKKNFDGLGDYVVSKITYQEGYIKSIDLKPKDKKQKTIKYRFYASEQDVINAYKIGNVDKIKISYLPSEFNNWNNIKVNKQIETNQKYTAIFINTQKLSSKQIRQALAYATPKTKDKNERCLGPISPISWAYNPKVKEYNQNNTRAKELLKDEQLESLKITVNDRQLLSIAEEIKNSWENIIGVPVSVSIENQINLDNYDVLLTYGAITQDPDQYLFWHSTQTNTNITKINNARIDKLLEEGRQQNDQIERKKIYQEFQTFLLEESPAIFLSYPTVYTITRSK